VRFVCIFVHLCKVIVLVGARFREIVRCEGFMETPTLLIPPARPRELLGDVRASWQVLVPDGSLHLHDGRGAGPVGGR
jgi:hypothetical protein